MATRDGDQDRTNHTFNIRVANPELLGDAKISSRPPGGNDHGTKIFQESIERRQTHDEEAQGGDIEERPFRQESQKPQTGDRDRPFRSESKRQEGTEEVLEEEEDEQEAQVEEIIKFVITGCASWRRPGIHTPCDTVLAAEY
jgi:hypothetical protein